MLRGILIVTATGMAFIATVVIVVGIGIHRLAATRQAMDASWQPPAAAAISAPATLPSDSAVLASSEQRASDPNDFSIQLWAKDAVLHGKVQLVNAPRPDRHDDSRKEHNPARARVRREMGGHPVTEHLTAFQGPDDYAEWPVEVPKAGEFEVEMTYSCPKRADGGHFIASVADRQLLITTESSRYETSFRVGTMGRLKLPAGKSKMILRPAPQDRNEHPFINLRCVELIPVS